METESVSQWIETDRWTDRWMEKYLNVHTTGWIDSRLQRHIFLERQNEGCVDVWMERWTDWGSEDISNYTIPSWFPDKLPQYCGFNFTCCASFWNVNFLMFLHFIFRGEVTKKTEDKVPWGCLMSAQVTVKKFWWWSRISIKNVQRTISGWFRDQPNILPTGGKEGPELWTKSQVFS